MNVVFQALKVLAWPLFSLAIIVILSLVFTRVLFEVIVDSYNAHMCEPLPEVRDEWGRKLPYDTMYRTDI